MEHTIGGEVKGIYRFTWDCGRSGRLRSIFVAERDEVVRAGGKKVYFGEVLGKHSDVYGTLEIGDIEFVSDDAADVETFERLRLATGYNPLDYLDEVVNGDDADASGDDEDAP